MTFAGRLKFYGFGFLLGVMIVYGMFGNRSCTTPNEIKMQELVFQKFDLSEKALCKLKCLKMNEALLKIQLRHFEVNYDLSTVRKKPCGEYFIQAREEHKKDYIYNLVMYDCDTITKINDINVLAANTCSCQ